MSQSETLPLPDSYQPPGFDRAQCYGAINICSHLMSIIGSLPDSKERTCAKARIEEAQAYLQKMIDDNPFKIGQ